MSLATSPIGFGNGHSEVAVLRRENAQLRDQIRKYEERWDWEKRLFGAPSSQLSASEKLTAWALKPLFQNREDRYAEVPETVYLPDPAEKIGVSTDTISRKIKNLQAAGGLRRFEFKYEVTGNTRIQIAPTPTYFDAPENMAPPKPRRHGGPRERCTRCGSENLVARVVITCQDCGERHEGPPRPVNPASDTPNQQDAGWGADQMELPGADGEVAVLEDTPGPQNSGDPLRKSDPPPVHSECTGGVPGFEALDVGATEAPAAEVAAEVDRPEFSTLVENRLGGRPAKPASRAEGPPEVLFVRPESVPDALKARPQWVAWRWERDGRHARWAKVPINPRTGGRACSDKSATWATLEEALAAYRGSDSGLSGIGYMFSGDDPYVAVDGDTCIDPETGRLAGEAEDVVFTLDSYTELSARGSGFHAIVEAEKPGDRCKGRLGDIGVEIYSHGRLFAFTGHRLPGTLATVESRQLELEAVYGLVFPQRPAPVPSIGSNGHRIGPAPIIAEVLARARAGKNGDRFERIWRGDVSDYSGPGESGFHLADLAFCGTLARCGADAHAIDALWRQSGLAPGREREKWDRFIPAWGMTHGAHTVMRALEDGRR